MTPITDMEADIDFGRNVPIATECTAANHVVLDHLVSAGEQRLRDREPERFGARNSAAVDQRKLSIGEISEFSRRFLRLLSVRGPLCRVPLRIAAKS
jgi:hypothetical protein